MDLSKIKKAYLIGIKGAGMTAIAGMLKMRGIIVGGSDTNEKFFTDEVLKKSGIFYHEKFSENNVPKNADLIIYSTAYNETNNAELAEAKKRGLSVLSYPEALSILFKEKAGIAVCGTHGKTTTTAILADCLKNAGLDPSAIVGSKVIDWQSGSLAGKGKYFVAEADEYQNKLQYYDPFAVVLTSVDWDHPDFFPTVADYLKVFSDFIACIPRHGFLVAWGDSRNVLEVAKSAKCEVIRYGFGDDNDLIIKKHGNEFRLRFKGSNLGFFKIKLIGDHNILNAAAAIATAYKLNADIEKVREAVANFQGTSRRFEFIGESNGAILIDDYAHHPEEIKATLKAARAAYPDKNITTVFHPHTFTRTKALLSEFSQSFNDTDKVIIIDIYGSAREIQGGVSSKELVDLINKYNRNKAEYIPTIDEVVNYLEDKISDKDVVISMGAGDVWKVANQLKL